MRSIITDDLKHCYICGTDENVELHHVIHGSKELRRLSTSAHILIPCCSDCHRGLAGIHGKYGEEKDLKVKAAAQEAWEKRRIKKGKSRPETVRDEWIKVFGKDFIGEFRKYLEECKQDLVEHEMDELSLDKLLKEIVEEYNLQKGLEDENKTEKIQE